MLPDQELVEIVFEHICEHHAEQVAELRDEEILRRAGMAVARARPYGFQKESSYAAFAALMFLVAPNFDEQLGIQSALRNPRLKADERMEQLMRNTREEDWDAAGAAADPRAWE